MINVAVISDRSEVVDNFLRREVRHLLLMRFHRVIHETDVISKRFDSAIILHYENEEVITRILECLQPCLATNVSTRR
jgi:hypothetical protein